MSKYARYVRAFWNHPFMDKWGKLVMVAIMVVPIFLFFVLTDLDDKTDDSITIGISIALALGVFASIATTEKYSSRGIGLLSAITGASIYFFFLFLVRSDRGVYYWMSDLTRAFFVIGAPIFAATTSFALGERIYVWFHRRRRYADSSNGHDRRTIPRGSRELED